MLTHQAKKYDHGSGGYRWFVNEVIEYGFNDFMEQDAQGFPENKVAARKGGGIAGDAREKLEIETKDDVISVNNYLTEPESMSMSVNYPAGFKR